MSYQKPEEIPGYKEELTRAYRRQTVTRDLSFIDYPRSLCGVAVRLPNLHDLELLTLARNSFICGGQRRRIDAGLVVWLLSDAWEPESGSRLNRWRVRRKRARFCGRLAAQYGDALLIQVEEFLQDVFMDAPKGGGGQGKGQLPVTSISGSYVHFFAYHYGWSERETMQTPLPRLFQYANLIRMELDPKFVPPQPVNEVKRKYLKIIRDMKKAKKEAQP